MSGERNKNKKRFVISGGGTGGHIYPAIAIAKMLMEKYPGCEITYIGGENGMEHDLVQREGIPFKGITVAGFKRKISLEVFITLAKASSGFIQTKSFLKEYRPDLVIGTGGYVSGPVLFAAKTLHIPIMLHEQNVYPGMTNRILSRYTKVSAISWQESKKFLKHPQNTVLTGNPIRAEIVEADRDESRIKLNLSKDLPVILIFGGSQGALRINQVALLAAADMVSKNNAQVILITGKAKFEEIKFKAAENDIKYSLLEGDHKHNNPGLFLTPYMYDMAAAMASADIVVCRSGAITLAELTARGIPAILIPHPYVPDNVQEKNARALEAKGAAVVILDGELDEHNLEYNIASLLGNEAKLASMAKASYNCGMRDSIQRIALCVDKALK